MCVCVCVCELCSVSGGVAGQSLLKSCLLALGFIWSEAGHTDDSHMDSTAHTHTVWYIHISTHKQAHSNSDILTA